PSAWMPGLSDRAAGRWGVARSAHDRGTIRLQGAAAASRSARRQSLKRLWVPEMSSRSEAVRPCLLV
ncbi:MAG: hypothetical protein M0Z95_24935, partial [Actinomycetota bacterium]|nr:hypothetical protein [Actinomycetota bacterium]